MYDTDWDRQRDLQRMADGYGLLSPFAHIQLGALQQQAVFLNDCGITQLQASSLDTEGRDLLQWEYAYWQERLGVNDPNVFDRVRITI